MREFQLCNMIPCLGYDFSYPPDRGAAQKFVLNAAFFDHSHPSCAFTPLFRACSDPISHVDEDTQKKIAALVKESYTLKTESEHLLNVAKRSLEIAIEQDEKAGMA